MLAQISGSETQKTSYLCHVCLGITCPYVRLNSHCFSVVGMVIKIIVGVYIPIIRIPVISGGIGGMSEHPQYKELIDPDAVCHALPAPGVTSKSWQRSFVARGVGWLVGWLVRVVNHSLSQLMNVFFCCCWSFFHASF